MIARSTALALVALALALVAAGCGGDEGPQIPRDEARSIIRRLQEADRRLSQDPPVCGDLSEDTLPELDRLVAALPEDTDEGVRDTVRDGVAHLRSLIEAECTDRETEPEETTTTTEEEPAPTTTTHPEPEPEPTTEPEPEPTTEPEPEPEPTTPTTPDPGNGNGNGGQGVPEGTVRPKKQKKDGD